MKKIYLPTILFFSLLLFFSFTEADLQSGSVTIGVYNKNTSKGKTVCVDVYTNDFDNILSMQYSLKWDKKILKFKSVDGMKLTGLSKNNFGTQRTDEGLLTFAWYDKNLKGISLPNGAVLYQVCFEVIGESGEKGYFRVTDFPTAIEVANGDGAFLNLNSGGGKVVIK